MLSKYFIKQKRFLLQKIQQNFSGSQNLKQAAVILTGSGVYDGSEITESVSLLIALNKRKINFQCYAPNIDQFDVINHKTGEEIQNQKRNVLDESARIARGNVKDLKELLKDNKQFQAIFLPGGFGAAKNISSFATKGAEMTVNQDLENILKDFHKQQKVIAACCISPVILAKIFGKIQITLGCEGEKWPYAGSIQVAQSFGAINHQCQVTQTYTDLKNKIVTAPAFMYEADFYEVYQSVENMVNEAVKIA